MHCALNRAVVSISIMHFPSWGQMHDKRQLYGQPLSSSRDVDNFWEVGRGGLASRIEFVACEFIYLSFDFCMCNTVYNLKAFFFPLLFLALIWSSFAVTTCTIVT